MKTWNKKFAKVYFGIAAAATLAFPQGPRASEATNKLLEEARYSTKRQAIVPLDKTGLRVILNDAMNGVNLEGWSTKALTPAESDAMLKQFGVRVERNGDPANGYLLAPPNVGRAGIAEGDVYLKLNGKIFKGLTLKGYGGNDRSSMGPQPKGSLDLAETFRDMEVSTVLTEGKVSSYLGVVGIDRPGHYSNYVRISRSALRMEDFIDIKGANLAKLVDYMTDLLKDEVGKKMTVAEFDEWLVKESADVLARKEHIRFRHASITNSNLGIGEMVDLGDTSNGSGIGGLMLPGQYTDDQSLNGEFRRVVESAHKNLATIDPSVKAADFGKMYETAFNDRMKQLRDFDAARVNLNGATVADLVKLGFTDDEAQMVVQYNAGTPDGIIDPSEIAQIKTISRDVTALIDRTTSDFMRLSDGTQLGQYYVRSAGGADGIRSILKETRDYMAKNKVTVARDAKGIVKASDPKLEAAIQKMALDRAKQLGLERVEAGDAVTNYSKFISTQILEVISKR